MTDFDLALIENDEKLMSLVTELFTPNQEKDGDFLAEDFQETLDYASIFQPTTTSVDQSGIYEDMKMGDVYSTRGVLGKSMSVCILSMWNSRSYYLRDKGEQLCSSPNGKTPIHTKFSSSCDTCRFARFSKGKPSECTKFINLLVMPENFKMKPYVLQLSRTSYKIGVTLAKQARSFGPQLFDTTFDIDTEKAKDAAFWRYKISGARPTTDRLKGALLAVQKYYSPIVQASISRHEIPEEEDSEIQALENVE